MKNKLLIIMVSILFLAGCENFLEVTPESFLSPQTFFDSEKNIEIAVSGVYDLLGDRGLGGNQ